MSIFRGISEGIRERLSPASPNALDVPAAIGPVPGAPALLLRPMTADDCAEWSEVRQRNESWLEPWESGDPTGQRLLTFNAWIARQRQDERAGTSVVFAMDFQGALAGQISLGAISYGSMRSGIIGYWVAHEFAGRGFAPLAVALLADWAFFERRGPKLHRLEIDILPENQRSRRVVQKVGATFEGVRRRYMYINGEWRDHESYSLLAQDAPEGFVRRLLGDTPGKALPILA